MTEFVSAYEDQVLRLIDAIAWGDIADLAWEDACEAVGLDPSQHYDSPLLAIVAASASGTMQ